VPGQHAAKIIAGSFPSLRAPIKSLRIVEVIGFADSRATNQYNLNLSTRRANSVIGYLVTKQNIPPHRLVQPFGFGEEQPVADNTTADGRAQNRRVEIRVLVNKAIANTLN